MEDFSLVSIDIVKNTIPFNEILLSVFNLCNRWKQCNKTHPYSLALNRVCLNLRGNKQFSRRFFFLPVFHAQFFSCPCWNWNGFYIFSVVACLFAFFWFSIFCREIIKSIFCLVCFAGIISNHTEIWVQPSFVQKPLMTCGKYSTCRIKRTAWRSPFTNGSMCGREIDIGFVCVAAMWLGVLVHRKHFWRVSYNNVKRKRC